MRNFILCFALLLSNGFLTAQNNYPPNIKNSRIAVDFFVTKRPPLSINGFDSEGNGSNPNHGRGLKQIINLVYIGSDDEVRIMNGLYGLSTDEIKLMNPTTQAFLTPDVPLQGAVVVME